MITWTPIAELPDELKDGREVLLWFPADGPQWEGGAVKVFWQSEGHWSTGFPVNCMTPTHFAEITPPSVPLWATEGESWELKPGTKVIVKDFPHPGDNVLTVGEAVRLPKR